MALILSAISPLSAAAAREYLAGPKPPSETSESPFYNTLGFVLNELGQIAGKGTYPPSSVTGGFFWSNGVLTDMGFGDAGVIFDINNKGMVVGQDGNYRRALLWENGVLTDLGGPEFLRGAAYAVNERGTVALFLEASGGPHAFLWERGTLTDLGPGFPTDLNERGQVVGITADEFGAHALLWDRGVVTDLTPDFDVDNSEQYRIRINNRGQVIVPGRGTLDGTVPAFLWEKGELTNLGSLGGDQTWSKDINERGQVVGVSVTATGEWHAFLWEGGVMTDLGLAGEESRAIGINERGQVIVHASSPGRLFVWERGVRTYLVDQDGNPVYSEGIAAINNHGQVMGNGGHAFLWERGHVTYVAGPLAASSQGQSPTPRLAETIGQESVSASRAGQAPGNVRTLLGAPSPNPSTGAAEFAIRLDRDDAVRISLYDTAGRLVASRAPEHLAAGSHSLSWDPGVQKAGLYFARMETGSGAAVIRRWVILR